jgi:hypothetical protein
MNLLDFIQTFPNEESCKLRFKQICEQEGVVCRKCGNKEHFGY